MSALVIDWGALRCQETTGMIGEDYIRCNAPAVAIVLQHKDQHAYPMCLGCADHNIRHRGGVLLTRKGTEL